MAQIILLAQEIQNTSVCLEGPCRTSLPFITPPNPRVLEVTSPHPPLGILPCTSFPTSSFQSWLLPEQEEVLPTEADREGLSC
jgi:hypothetical protein